ncbi:hypothetical protein [Alteromonas gracilis]|uniref:hypothetical protein n=1 Tax=Alteromonas gracilis TaxID=1479524 RepID=UPI0030CEA57A
MFRFVLLAMLGLSITACGGPSNSDIEDAVNAQLEVAKSFQSLAGGNDICPADMESLQQENYTVVTSCLAWHGQVEDVEIDKCVEKENNKFSCLYKYTLTSKRYGNQEAEQEAVFEENAAGWVLIN